MQGVKITVSSDVSVDWLPDTHAGLRHLVFKPIAQTCFSSSFHLTLGNSVQKTFFKEHVTLHQGTLKNPPV